MPLDEIVILLRWLAATMTVLAIFVVWAAVMVLNAFERLSQQVSYGIQHAGEAGPVSTSTDAPDDSKVTELDPWHEEQTVADLVARSE